MADKLNAIGKQSISSIKLIDNLKNSDVYPKGPGSNQIVFLLS